MAWPDTVWAYSDGAKVKDGGAGAGWTLVVDNTTCAEGSKPLGTWQEVADAEAIAALHAMQAAHELPQETTGDLYLCLDNRGIVNRLNAEEGDLGTSQTVIDETRRLLASWKLRQGGLFAPKARVRWVPGHKNIPGNERADRLARGVAGTEVGGLEMSLSRAKRWCREQAATEFKTWWGGAERAFPYRQARARQTLEVQGLQRTRPTRYWHIDGSNFWTRRLFHVPPEVQAHRGRSRLSEMWTGEDPMAPVDV
ncbi:uncharacterized protein BROUX77_004139 [Berkeleyomyces rouxiae]|uniref:uncharacterized protein n=1 Tax=Berkeleyomyces rouxiae TaxID=2035830 RepID=UPI003B7797D9